MALLGVLALIAAAAAAVWLMLRQARGKPGGEHNVTALKAIIWLGLAGALFAAKLWPLAFMLLVAAGGVSAIEMWREREVRETTATPPVPVAKLGPEEAASVLGVPVEASPEDIRSAHKRLIGQLHPDKGGSDYLAAKINDARDVLLKTAALREKEGAAE